MSKLEIFGIEAIGSSNQIFEEIRRWVVGIGAQIEELMFWRMGGVIIGKRLKPEEIRGKEVAV